MVVTKEANSRIKKAILSGQMVTPEEVEAMRTTLKEIFMKGGDKRFIEILEGEFENLPMDVEISIAGKQKNLAESVSKLNSFFRILFTPGAVQAIQQNPELNGLLNEILEGSGMSPIKYGVSKQGGQPVPSPMQGEQPELANVT